MSIQKHGYTLKPVWKVAATMLLLALLATPLELAVRWAKGGGEARHDTVDGGYIPIRLKPNYRGTTFDLPFETNSQGFREPEDIPLETPPGELRILALGDSVGVGLGLPLHERYTSVLQQQLNREMGSTVRVINAAGQGYSPSSYLLYLKREGLDFSPALVLIQIELCNDITDEALLNWHPSGSGPLSGRAVRGGRYQVVWDGNLVGTISRGDLLLETTYTYTLLLRRLLTISFEKYPSGIFAEQPDIPYFHLGFDRIVLTQERIERGWRTLFASLEAAHRILRDVQVPLLVLVMPSRYAFQKEGSSRRRYAEEFLERTDRQLKRLQIDSFDLVDPFREGGGSRLFFDFAHPTAEGSAIIGRHLSARVQEMLNHPAGAEPQR